MARKVRRKNYRIDVTKLERARKALGTRTETETIHRAIEVATNEAGLARALQNLIVKGRGRIEDMSFTSNRPATRARREHAPRSQQATYRRAGRAAGSILRKEP